MNLAGATVVHSRGGYGYTSCGRVHRGMVATSQAVDCKNCLDVERNRRRLAAVHAVRGLT